MEQLHLFFNDRYALSIDGSSDSGVEKMNPLTVRIFNPVHGIVHFLDMCMSSSTAEGIFLKMQGALENYDISWMNCVGIGLDKYGLYKLNQQESQV